MKCNKHHTSLGDLVDKLSIINARIFALEAEIRNCGDLPDEETGRRAKLIRDLNAERVALRNGISAFDTEGFPDIKVNHRSQR